MFERAFLLDTLERSVRTFLQAFAAFVVVQGNFSQEALVGGLVAAGLAVLSSLAAIPVGAKDSASFLPAAVDPPSEAARREAMDD